MADRACKCLNVRIRPQPHERTTSPQEDAEFEPLYVGEIGLTVVHTHLTLRTRNRINSSHESDSSPSSSQVLQHVSLTCLICHLLVYRVLQATPLDVDSSEGPVLPTEDWVEEEVLRSSSGWIDVSKQCIIGEAIVAAEKSPYYSPIFNVVLPTPPPSPSADFTWNHLHDTTSNGQHETYSHLPPLPPLFPPAPFTPSHVVFRQLDSLASTRSHVIRQAADDYLAQVIQAKVAEIHAAEDILRSQVQALWIEFKEGLSTFDKGGKDNGVSGSSRKDGAAQLPQSGAAMNTIPSSNGTAKSPVSIPDFVPSPSARARVASPSLRQSALSASMATSSFHHPRYQQENATTASFTNGARSTSQVSSARSSPPHNSFDSANGVSNGSLRTSFRRDMNEDKDIATSFKYVVDIEAQMKEAAQARDAGRSKSRIGVVQSPTEASTAAADIKNEETGEAKTVDDKTPPSSPKQKQSQSKPDVETSPPKTKRKVTFDIKADTTLPSRNGTTDANQDDEAIIFDLEDETGESHHSREDSSSTDVLPLVENPHVPPNRPPAAKRNSSGGGPGLPQSFSLLRPSSLPAPSALRASPSTSLSQDIQPGSERKDSSSSATSVYDDQPLSPREEEISRLVAAGTPSHRSAWRRDGKAWDLFGNRSGGKPRFIGSPPAQVDEEDEDDEGTEEGDSVVSARQHPSSGVAMPPPNSEATHWSQTLAKSLPMVISPLSKSISREPKTSYTDRYGVLVPPLRPSSSVAQRKAQYAERDRSRPMDPGALDFIELGVGDDDELGSSLGSDAEIEGMRGGVGVSVNTGRQRALKILQARSRLPSDGMWRSLAA